MQKKARRPSALEKKARELGRELRATEPVNLRLPVALVNDLKRAAAVRPDGGWNLTQEIRERLAGSI